LISTLTELRNIVALVDTTEYELEQGTADVTRDEWHWMKLTRRLACDILDFYTA